MLERYAAYQQRYAREPRESDRALIELLRREAAPRLARGERPWLLDAGCSTGNLLRHIRSAMPDLRLSGADLAPRFVEAARRDPDLAGIDFGVLDLLDLGARERYDFVTAHAVCYLFGDEDYPRALASMARALRPGGAYLGFELIHGFAQELCIRETSRSHPDGLVLHFRPMQQVERLLRQSGFERAEFHPFAIGRDLPRGATWGGNADGFEDLNSYTVRTDDGQRLLFRGALYQPWCHVVAWKSAGA
jgi:SAM-dependent methyltransferase